MPAPIEDLELKSPLLNISVDYAFRKEQFATREGDGLVGILRTSNISD